MKRHLIAALIVFVLGMGAMWGIAKYLNKRDAGGLTPGFELMNQLETQGLAEFSFKTLDGASHDIREFEGHLVVMNFWASWCAPCIEEVPSLIKLVDRFGGRVKLIAVSGDSELQDIEVFLKSFPGLKREHIYLVFDEDKSIMQRFNVLRLPESFVFGTDLKLERKIVGTIDWFTEDAVAYVEELLSDKD